MLKQSPENLVLQAVMDEFEENREKGNLTAELLNKEKVRKTFVSPKIGCWCFSDPRILGAVAASQQTFFIVSGSHSS